MPAALAARACSFAADRLLPWADPYIARLVAEHEQEAAELSAKTCSTRPTPGGDDRPRPTRRLDLPQPRRPKAVAAPAWA